MDCVFLVVAHDNRGIQGDMLIAAYDNQRGATDHAAHINGIDNEFTASVKFMHYFSEYQDKLGHYAGMRDIAYFEG